MGHYDSCYEQDEVEHEKRMRKENSKKNEIKNKLLKLLGLKKSEFEILIDVLNNR